MQRHNPVISLAGVAGLCVFGGCMNVTTSIATKICITDVPRLDPISVYLEDLGPERGKVTITCFDDSWTNFWGSMGKGRTVRDFFIGCDNGYLCSKFASGLYSTVEDFDQITAHARKGIIDQRKESIAYGGSFTKDVARELWDDAENLSSYHTDLPETYADLMYKIFGDEWWHGLPQKPNYKYDYICRILDAVKEALSAPDTES